MFIRIIIQLFYCPSLRNTQVKNKILTKKKKTSNKQTDEIKVTLHFFEKCTFFSFLFISEGVRLKQKNKKTLRNSPREREKQKNKQTKKRKQEIVAAFVQFAKK